MNMDCVICSIMEHDDHDVTDGEVSSAVVIFQGYSFRVPHLNEHMQDSDGDLWDFIMEHKPSEEDDEDDE